MKSSPIGNVSKQDEVPNCSRRYKYALMLYSPYTFNPRVSVLPKYSAVNFYVKRWLAASRRQRATHLALSIKSSHTSLVLLGKDEGRVRPPPHLCFCPHWKLLFLGNAAKCFELSVWDSPMEVPALPEQPSKPRLVERLGGGWPGGWGGASSEADDQLGEQRGDRGAQRHHLRGLDD